MGLDMYLYTERYLPAYDHSTDDEKAQYAESIKAAGLTAFDNAEDAWSHSATVRVMSMYWRKANHIHAWFVDHVQDGVDECQDSYVSADQLRELLATCRAALTAYEAGSTVAAGEHLPPRSGFFFGSTEVDQWWAEDTRATITALERILKAYDEAKKSDVDVSFYYRASW